LPALIDRAREIRSVLDADASLRAAGRQTSPHYLSGVRRDGVDDACWRTMVGEIEQYRAAYGIDSNHPLGPRPNYNDMTRVDRYRQLDHDLNQLARARTRDHEIGLGIER
jgi:hypothetical protein